MSVDLSPLRLPPEAERVLRALLDGIARSRAVLGRELNLNAMAVSRAVQVLEQCGLVRISATRPESVTLAGLEAVVRAEAEPVEEDARRRHDAPAGPRCRTGRAGAGRAARSSAAGGPQRAWPADSS